MWSNGYVGVWHLQGDPGAGAGSQPDSTTERKAGTALDVSSDQRVEGQIGKALAFDGGDVVRIDDSASSGALGQVLAPFTLSAWVNLADNVDGTVLARRESSTTQWQLELERIFLNDTAPTLIWDDGSGFQCVVAATTAMPRGGWHHVAATLDAGLAAALFIDGAPVGASAASSCSGPPVFHAIDVAIGARWAGEPNPGFALAGGVDEARVENVARSAAWIHAQFLSMTGAFAVPGALEALP